VRADRLNCIKKQSIFNNNKLPWLLITSRVKRIIESAKSSEERKQYNQAQAEALSKGIRHFLFYVYDRKTRNLTDNEKNEALVREGKIVIHHVRENKIIHKNSSDSDFFLRDIHAVTSKQFIRNLRTKVNDAARYKANMGWYPGSRPPLGYMCQKERNEDGREIRGSMAKIVPTTNMRKICQIKREFELRAEGCSLDQVRQRVIREGIVPPSKQSSYNKSTLEDRLRNKFYWGYFDWQGVEYKGKH